VADITKKSNTNVSNILDDILETAGEGVDYETSELQIPFIRVIQALSPQIKKSDAAFIKGAEQGDLFNTVTGEVWKGEEGINVIPCYQETKHLEFTPRDQGGGFVGELPAGDPNILKTTRQGAKETLPSGNELVKSDQHYCMVLNKDGSAQPAIVDMKSTQLKISRRWKTQIAMQKIPDKNGVMRTPALFATIWNLKTVEESNDMGTWYNYTIEKVDLVKDKNLFIDAKNFRSSVESGAAKAVPEEVVTESDEAPF
jgi:hypothetical protein|tara:strand:- start:316 stop:1083 length:768 start_codon:yes stop_codon:yes gene_type:complete